MPPELDILNAWTVLAIVSVVGGSAAVCMELFRAGLTRRLLNAARESLAVETETLRSRADELEKLMASMAELQDKLGKERLTHSVLSRKASRSPQSAIRFIHEIGRREPRMTLFTFPIRSIANWERKLPERVVFHPMIWTHANEVQVWAQEYSAAQYLARSIFNEAAGVQLDVADEETAEKEPE